MFNINIMFQYSIHSSILVGILDKAKRTRHGEAMARCPATVQSKRKVNFSNRFDTYSELIAQPRSLFCGRLALRKSISFAIVDD